jgi:acyl-coenzyme A thioesterase PaaI-like protein
VYTPGTPGCGQTLTTALLARRLWWLVGGCRKGTGWYQKRLRAGEQRIVVDAVVPRGAGGVTMCQHCRATSVCQLGVNTQRVGPGGHLLFELKCPAQFEGGPGVAHGGWIAAVMDETLGRVPQARGQLTVTGSLAVRYGRPVPVGLGLEVAAWVDRVERKKWFVAGELRLSSSSAVLTTATGVMIARDTGSHLNDIASWMATQDLAQSPSRDVAEMDVAETHMRGERR